MKTTPSADSAATGLANTPHAVHGVLAHAIALSPDGLAVDVARRMCVREQLAWDDAIAQIDTAELLIDDSGVLRLAQPTAAANIAASLDDAERRRVHELIAEAIADTALDMMAAAHGRAWHLAEAGHSQRALQLLVQAGELHEVNGEFEAALACYDDALALRSVCAAVEVLDRRAVAADSAGSDRAADCWHELAEAMREAGDGEGQARALYHLYWSTREDDARRWLVQASQVDDGNKGWSMRAAALLEILASRYDRAAELDMAVLRLARDGGDLLLEALALLGIGVSYALLGDMEAAIRAQRQSISISLARRDHRATVSGRLNLVMCLLDDLRMDEALAESRDLLVYIDQHGLEAWRAEARVLHADALARAGRMHEARAETTAAFEAITGRDDGVTQAFTATVHARVMIDTGSSYDFDAALELARSCATKHGVEALLQEIDSVRAQLAAAGGELDAAMQIARGMQIEQDLPLTAAVAVWMARQASLAGRVEVAREAAALCERFGSATARVVEQSRREVIATVGALEGGDATPLIEAAKGWRVVGRGLDAQRALVSVGCVQIARGERAAAAETFMQAHRDLLDGGSLADLELVSAHLRDLADSGDDSAPRFVDESQVFAGLSERQLAEVDAMIATARHDQGKVFYSPEDDHGTVYFLRSGRVRLYCMTEDGKRLTVEMLDPGSVFGESALLGRPAAGLYAEADEPVVVGVMPTARMRELIRLAPRVGMNLLELVGERLHRSRAQTEQVAFWTVNQRIARVLLELDERYGHPTLAGGRLINRVFTHSDIAELVNARRETVGEYLKLLRSQGVIELRKRRIVLLDLPALRSQLD